MNFTWDPPTSIVRIFFIDILAVVRFLMMRYNGIDGSLLQELKEAAQVRNDSERIRFLIQKQQRVTLFADTGRGLN
jgi:hypothetical protein